MVQITNFTVRTVDTDFSPADNDRCRRHYALAVPNLLQEFVGRRQLFADVTRTTVADPTTADYVVSADYDFLLHAGTHGREWIPFYSGFGKINEAVGRDTIDLHVTDARSGTEVLHRAFTEEHRERVTIREAALVYLLQADYMSGVAAALIDAIRAHETSQH